MPEKVLAALWNGWGILPYFGGDPAGNVRLRPAGAGDEQAAGLVSSEGIVMPWFPDFASAVELARLQDLDTGKADQATQYFELLTSGDTRALDSSWPGDVTIYDPKAGVVHGRRRIHQFVKMNHSWLGALHARTERVASVTVPGRAVVELLAHLTDDGRELSWPIAVVAETDDDRSVIFRTYCRAWPIKGPHQLRPAILPPGADEPGDVAGRYQTALEAGDAGAIVGTFAADGYYQEADGPGFTHRGHDQLRSFFTRRFSAGGGIGIRPGAVTDDGLRCVLEYTCVRWGSHDLTPQAGLAVYERGPDGLLASVREYDDIAPPPGLDES
jgi:ketosteroid isomerase-like protein